ncbi:HNH endonuclease [Agrobacterium tumefaciens]|uniref:HNH endonuclease n=1 Tax=Agrobacterium tumefaciens TaxID=358 RepID=UPI001573B4D1|nr:HNH endonuclease [Agrobacterium tumefaciens]NSX92664.1 HNH endonuclease [Agrobacterium tumefaciens]NSX92725.1 HNH endonuclease [Agrobacterium tumefaciens]
MGRLTTLKSRIGSLPPRLGHMSGDEKARLKERDSNVSWRAWYGLERWKRLRKKVWLRDLYTCQKTGVLCIGTYPAPNSPVADHKIPHRGDPDLFWDENNLETVSKAYHDSQKQKEERSQGRW